MTRHIASLDEQGLRIDALSVRYGAKPIIGNLHLPLLERGSVTALVGPNGAGKSTLLRALAGLNTSTGQLWLDGQPMETRSHTKRAAHLGYMPQMLPPDVDLTVLETVVASLRAAPMERDRCLPRKAYVHHALTVLTDLGIAAFADRLLSELSGGQRQLVSLAQAVARRPDVLLLDEPTSALDLRYQVLVLNRIVALAREHRLVVLVVLHDIAIATRYAQRIAVLKAGALYTFGSPAQAVTPEMFEQVYGVSARVEHCSQGHLQIMVDQAL